MLSRANFTGGDGSITVCNGLYFSGVCAENGHSSVADGVKKGETIECLLQVSEDNRCVEMSMETGSMENVCLLWVAAGFTCCGCYLLGLRQKACRELQARYLPQLAEVLYAEETQQDAVYRGNYQGKEIPMVSKQKEPEDDGPFLENYYKNGNLESLPPGHAILKVARSQSIEEGFEGGTPTILEEPSELDGEDSSSTTGYPPSPTNRLEKPEDESSGDFTSGGSRDSSPPNRAKKKAKPKNAGKKKSSHLSTQKTPSAEVKPIGKSADREARMSTEELRTRQANLMVAKTLPPSPRTGETMDKTNGSSKKIGRPLSAPGQRNSQPTPSQPFSSERVLRTQSTNPLP